jgi:hypothetical protein
MTWAKSCHFALRQAMSMTENRYPTGEIIDQQAVRQPRLYFQKINQAVGRPGY